MDDSLLPIKFSDYGVHGVQAMKKYLNFKGFFIVLMSLVDAEYWFIWASVGASVNTHCSILLRSTDLWKIIVRGGMIPNVVQEVQDIEIPPLFWVKEPFHCERLLHSEKGWRSSFFLSGFSFTNIHKSQDCKEGGGHFFNSSLPFPPASQTPRH